MTVDAIARELGGKKIGSRWMAPCPAHDDNNPSLSISECGGKLLVHCFTGCPQRTVIDALRARGLWEEKRASSSLSTTTRTSAGSCCTRSSAPILKAFFSATRTAMVDGF